MSNPPPTKLPSKRRFLNHQHRCSPERIEKYPLEEIATFTPTPLLQENTTAVEQKPFPFLSLPGEIRNLIYRHALVSPKTYTVKLQFFPLDTALLRVNKQVYAEASDIFYHENIFWFPQTLFVGGPILERLERVYHLPPRKLQTMRNFVIDIPVCVHFDLLRFPFVLPVHLELVCLLQLSSTSVTVPSANF